MGREAHCRCRWPGGETVAKVLLEGRELILRGEVRRKLPLASITDVRAEGDELCFSADGEAFALELGARQASSWAIKIQATPPSLAQKLGLGPICKARVVGPVADQTLCDALTGSIANEDEVAGLGLAVVANEIELNRALEILGVALSGKPIWVIHRKGPQAAFGEAAVRRHMRAAGYIDVKVCAVSDTLSATRYSPR